ncbi:hypothetical protein HK096_009102 [Nowakowskiella sp. JEL0078]|nr:hypothetical protein HK096_009102 [Nowakowskiella sp. JEL0078]
MSKQSFLSVYRQFIRLRLSFPADSKRRIRLRDYILGRVRQDFSTGKFGGGFEKKVLSLEKEAQDVRNPDHLFLKNEAIRARSDLEDIQIKGGIHESFAAGKIELEALKKIANGNFEKEFEIPRTHELFTTLPPPEAYDLLNTDSQKIIEKTSAPAYLIEYIRSQMSRR